MTFLCCSVSNCCSPASLATLEVTTEGPFPRFPRSQLSLRTSVVHFVLGISELVLYIFILQWLFAMLFTEKLLRGRTNLPMEFWRKNYEQRMAMDQLTSGWCFQPKLVVSIISSAKPRGTSLWPIFRCSCKGKITPLLG